MVFRTRSIQCADPPAALRLGIFRSHDAPAAIRGLRAVTWSSNTHAEAMSVLLQQRTRHCRTVSLAVVLALLALVCLEQAGGLSVNSPTSTSTSWLLSVSTGSSTTRRRGLSHAESRRGREGGVAASPTMGIAYNPNDELRAIVQRKQHEVKSLLAAHSAKDDPLQVHHAPHTPCRKRMTHT